MFSIDNLVTTSACGGDARLKLFSALQMMQDCSEMWMDSEPAFKQYFEEEGMTQFLASRSVEIVRVPEYKEKLRTITSVYDIRPMFGFRNTFIYDAQGEVCYKSWSIGAFANRSTGKLQRVPDDVLSTVFIEPRKEMTYGERRIVAPKGLPFKEMPAVNVERNDIDYNHHMNNANYARIALECLPADFTYSKVNVEFKRAAKFGETITPRIGRSDDGIFYVELLLGADLCTVVEFC